MMTYRFSVFLIIFLFLSGCSKDENGAGGDADQPLVFKSLVAEKDTLAPGQSTKITATATGYQISYTWAATAGDLLGNGDSVTYATSPCHIGKNKITCTIRDKKNETQTKEIYIVVE
jgi:hypothetical protein